jgi:antitoxin HicB
MRAFIYPAVIEEPYPGDFVVRFPDVPEAITGGDTREGALGNAPDALTAALEHYLDRGQAIPAPRPARRGEVAVPLDPSVAARVILVEAMASQGLTKVALAGRMQKDEKVVRRILAGKGASLELTFAALRAAGVEPVLAG